MNLHNRIIREHGVQSPGGPSSDGIYEGSYGLLRPLMLEVGARCSPREFYWAVNDAYHAAEAHVYDLVHDDMYQEEEPVWRRLLSALPAAPRRLTILDVGCGTGLVEDFIARIRPERIKEIHLLDPSAAMLEVALCKARAWPFEIVQHLGDVHSLGPEVLFDAVTANSVLHHVVELEPFLAKLERAVRPDGVLLTAQDPRSGANLDAVLRERRGPLARGDSGPKGFVRHARHAAARLLKSTLGFQRQSPLAASTNRALLNNKVITKRMDIRSIWAVTDFHVPGQPGAFGHGIDIGWCSSCMPSMALVHMYTYHYHDRPWKNLSSSERVEESIWWESNDQHGGLTAAVFRKLEM